MSAVLSGELSRPFPSVAGLSSLGAYLSLAKPRVVSLVLFTALVACFAAAGGTPSWATVGVLVLSGSLAAGGVAALNHYYDRDLDARMSRTRRRPLPSGAIANPRRVLAGGLAAVAAGLALAASASLTLALFELVGALVYAAVYTLWLKRRSALNVVIGGAAGSAAVLGGWGAAEPGLGLAPWLLAGLVFLWTPAHFWALAVARRDDYQRAGVPMLPVVVGPRRAARWVAIHVLGTLILSLWYGAAAQAGVTYFAAALASGGAFLLASARLLWRPAPGPAWATFKLSGVYLGLVFLGLFVDVIG